MNNSSINGPPLYGCIYDKLISTKSGYALIGYSNNSLISAT